MKRSDRVNANTVVWLAQDLSLLYVKSQTKVFYRNDGRHPEPLEDHPLSVCATMAFLSAYCSLLTETDLVFVLALSSPMLNRSFIQSLKVTPIGAFILTRHRTSSRKTEKSVGASTQLCLTPARTTNSSVYSPSTRTDVFILYCRSWMILTNLLGQPIL